MRKVRNKVIGTIGDAYLSYDRYKQPLFLYTVLDINQMLHFIINLIKIRL